MSKQGMDWHIECQRNQSRSLEEKRARLARMAAEVDRAARDLAFYDAQIAFAEGNCLSGFDRDRLLAKRAPKVIT